MVFAFVPVFSLATCAVAHILLTRIFPRLFRLSAAMYSFTLGLGCVAISVIAFAVRMLPEHMNDVVGYAILWSLSYVSFAHCYFSFFNLGEAGRRIRLVIELYSAGDKGMTIEELLTAYNARMILGARINRLLVSGQIVEKDERYFVGQPVMLYLAKALVLMKVLFLGGKSEFDCVVPPTRRL